MNAIAKWQRMRRDTTPTVREKLQLPARLAAYQVTLEHVATLNDRLYIESRITELEEALSAKEFGAHRPGHRENLNAISGCLPLALVPACG